jgi:hypothetical protein
LQGATSGEAQTLELACTSWATAFESGDDAKDNEEVAARNTLERELEWAPRVRRVDPPHDLDKFFA